MICIIIYLYNRGFPPADNDNDDDDDDNYCHCYHHNKLKVAQQTMDRAELGVSLRNTEMQWSVEEPK